MIYLYSTTDKTIEKVKFYRDAHQGYYVKSSLGTNSAVLFRKISITDRGEILFYGETHRESDVEITESEPSLNVQRYS